MVVLVGGYQNCSKVEFYESTSNDMASSGPDADPDSRSPDPPDNTFRAPPSAKPFTKTESFVNNNNSSVDILFVVDNSLSMYEEQTKVAEELESFLDGLGGSDWQIGITTTDIDGGYYSTNGELLNFISGGNTYRTLTPEVQNVDLLFRYTMQRDETLYCGRLDDRSKCVEQPSAEEKPFGAIAESIRLRDSKNSGFFRPSSDLAFIILSDEDTSDTIVPEDLVNLFQRTWGYSKKVTVHGIIIEPGDTDCYNQQLAQMENRGWAGYARGVTRAVKYTGGVIGSICDIDYSSILSTIGASISPSSFRLSRTPVTPVQMTITVTDKTGSKVVVLPASKYKIIGRNITFNQPVPQGARIDITYLTK